MLEAQQGFGPPSLPVGTEVSAKYRGAFCEAKVKTVVRIVKCKVTVKDCQSNVFVNDDDIKGVIKLGAVVEVKHPDTGQPVEATINKLIDHSTYTVVFDDGDERTLRRSQLCLKGDKHFIESETLDNLPLSHPEHFGTPVLQNKKAKRKHENESDEEVDTSEEESPRRATYRGRHQELVGKLMLVDLPQRKGSLIPALVVLPDANSLNEVKNRDQILVRSFKDSKFMVVTRKDLKDFLRAVVLKNEDKTMRTAIEKALLYFDTKELPVGWDKQEMLGSDLEDDEDGEEENEYASEDEPFEEKDRFVAQLYKFMDDRGTPINKGPCIGNKDLNLYKLFKIVQNLGGYNKVTKEMKWPVVYSKMGLPSLHQNPAHQIRTAYKKYLDAYETFYRKLGSTMGTLSRPGRARQNSGRSILNFRGRERSPRSPKPPEKVCLNLLLCEFQVKEDTESPKRKVEVTPEKSEETNDTTSPVPFDENDVVTRRTARRDPRALSAKDESKEKKEETLKGKKDDKKEDSLKKKKEDKKEETPSAKGKKETVLPTPRSKEDVLKGKDDVKKEDRKSLRKNKGEEEKEDKRLEKVVKKEEDKKEEVKVDLPPTLEKESPKKRVTRRKLMSADLKSDSELKEEVDDKKEAVKKQATKETSLKLVEKKEIPKTLERRDNKASEKKEPVVRLPEKTEPKLSDKKIKIVDDKKPKKEKKLKEDDVEEHTDNNNFMQNSVPSDEEDEADTEKLVTDPKMDFPIGSKLKVKYGRGKNQKIYIAKVVDFGRDGLHKTYLVHYAGWNTRYDEWIRPDRVVAILDKPTDGENRIKTPPSKPLISSGLKKISNDESKTPSLKKSGQVFRTPKMIGAKTRATRSSSSDTSVVGKSSDKRLTRRRSILADSTGSKSPESHMSSDAEDATGSERADDDDENTKSEKEDEDDILNVDDDEEDEDDPEREKFVDLDTSLEEGENVLKITSSSEAGSERIENEELEEPRPAGSTETIDFEPSEEESNVKTENKKEIKDTIEPATEALGKVSSEAKKIAQADFKPERASVLVSEVKNAVDEIKSLEYSDEINLVEGEDVKISDGENTVVESDKLGVDSESHDLKTIEESITESPHDDTESPEVKPNVSQNINENCAPPAEVADDIINQTIKIEIAEDQDKKDKDFDKPKLGRGRKKDTVAKDAKRPFKALDVTTGLGSAQEVPNLEPLGVASGCATSKTDPSPYDFDAEVEMPWQPEITKKWEPTLKTPVKDVKEPLTGSEEGDEKDKKKVKKKTKRKNLSPDVVGEVKVNEESLASPDIAIDNISKEETPSATAVADPCSERPIPKKKGRKKKELSSEAKKEVIEQYESTVNSVVEAVKHSLQETESDHEQRPIIKRRRVKRVSESDKKDTVVRVGKMGRKVVSRDFLNTCVNVDAVEDKIKEEPVLNSQTEALSRSSLAADLVAASSSCQDLEDSSVQKDRRKEPSFSESQGFEPQLEQHDVSAPFDNTPPTTPEHDDELSGAMHHQQNLYNSDDLSSKSDTHKDSMKVVCSSSSTTSLISIPAPSSGLAPSKSASESPSDNDVTSTASTDNFDTTPTAQQSESSGTDQDVPSSNKRRKPMEELING
ncbi:unnamed protein product, partial [Lymnaea stagnalis]